MFQCSICKSDLEVIIRVFADSPFADGLCHDLICHCCCCSVEWDEDNNYRLRTVDEIMDSGGWDKLEAVYSLKAIKLAIRKSKPLQCPCCDFQATSKAGIGLHIKAKHRDETEVVEKHKNDMDDLLVCEFCGYEAKSKSGITLHVKSKH
jgi:hypothetical protein